MLLVRSPTPHHDHETIPLPSEVCTTNFHRELHSHYPIFNPRLAHATKKRSGNGSERQRQRTATAAAVRCRCRCRALPLVAAVAAGRCRCRCKPPLPLPPPMARLFVFSWGLTCLAAWVKNEFDADAVGRNSPSGPKQPLSTNLHTGPKQPLSPSADLTSRRGDPCRNVAPAHPSPQGTAETTETAERLLSCLPFLGRRCLLLSVVG